MQKRSFYQSNETQVKSVELLVYEIDWIHGKVPELYHHLQRSNDDKMYKN